MLYYPILTLDKRLDITSNGYMRTKQWGFFSVLFYNTLPTDHTDYSIHGPYRISWTSEHSTPST